jgi:sensor histidine kinase regulating citrate/malate metabolism
MRSQKHDFNNHLQVISSLIQSKKFDNCFDYIININKHGLSKNNIHTGMLAINALLSSKQDIAQNCGIDMKINILTSIPESFNIQSWEIICVLGNLIDNAIHEEKKSIKEQKLINFSFNKQGIYLEFMAAISVFIPLIIANLHIPIKLFRCTA